MAPSIDLNCDLGEGFGAYTLGRDEELMPLVTSANIACGFHAGDPATMRATVQLAVKHGVAIGAHPGFPDLVGFGRRAMHASVQEVQDMVTYQLGALDAFVRAEGGVMRHVKPHGALYNMAAKDRDAARAIALAMRRFNAQLILFGLSGSELIAAGKSLGLPTASEVFADRTYEQNGSLTPRSATGAAFNSPDKAARQVIHILQTGNVISRHGAHIPVEAETVCIHGDGPQAVATLQAVRAELAAAGIAIRAFRPQ